MAGEAAAPRAVRRLVAAAGTPRPAGSCTRAVRRPAGAKRPRMRRGGRCSGSESASEAPGAAGPATPKAPLRQRPRRLPGARAARAGAGGSLDRAARRGTRVGATRRCRQPRSDPVTYKINIKFG
ncbi:Sphingomyelin Phosphodiesterase 4 [Manis pentadactyla]|nr:Sphingomyelin Phosphodiesterase 4 [Manis pentadactyla]